MKSLYSLAVAFAVATSTFYAVRGQEDVRSRSSSEPNQTNLTVEDHKLTNSTRTLMHQYRKASQDQKAPLEKQLRDVVTKHFKVRQQMRDQEIEQLTVRINELKQLQQRREAQSDKIVEDQLQHLLREADGLGWGGENPQGASFSFVQHDFSSDAAPLVVEAFHPIKESVDVQVTTAP